MVTIWKLEDPEVLRKERAIKEDMRRAKEEQRMEAARKQRERDEKSRIPPSELFLNMVDLYSAFDLTNGIPTHDKAGELLSKGAVKKLQKEREKQVELHEKWLARNQDEESSSR